MIESIPAELCKPANTPPAPRKPRSALVSRNITIASHRTSVRLEPEMWSALGDICRRERASMNEVCTVVANAKPDNSSLTAAIRVFVMAYFRAAATEDGHGKVGHGRGAALLNRPVAPNLVPAPNPNLIGSAILGMPVRLTTAPSAASSQSTAQPPRQTAPAVPFMIGRGRMNGR